MSMARRSEFELAMETLMEDFDVRQMGLSMGRVTGVAYIKFGGRFIYPKEVTCIRISCQSQLLGFTFQSVYGS